MTSSDIFEGITAMAQVAMTLSVSAGVWVAYKQLHSWRDQRRSAMVSDLALELLTAVEEASDQLKALRSPLDSIPRDKINDPIYKYQKRLDRYNEAAPIFQRVRKAQLRANAVIDRSDIEEHVNTLLEVRHISIVAIQMLAERNPSDVAYEDQQTTEMYNRMQREMYGTYSEKYDPLGMKQLAAVDELRLALKPLIKVAS